MNGSLLRRSATLAGAGLLACLVAAPALAHAVQTVGSYTLEIGWQHEPTYVGETNGVQVIVTDANDDPVTDLTEDDLKVVVSTGSDQSGELTFEPAFDLQEGDGPMGQYNAPIMPTAPGDYTFHITGSLHGQAVDVTVTSSDETFDTVKGTTEIQVPVKVPTMPEVVTRLDRLDARVGTAQSATGPTQASVDAAQAEAADALASAERSLTIAVALGLLAVLVGALALIVAVRATRRAKA